jgi:biopolymer transport protein ExbB/TolQ
MTGIGGIISIIMALLVLLAPIFLYLTQRNTYQTRQELRKLNATVKTLTDIAEKHQQQQLAAEKQAAAQAAKLVTMTCPHCHKEIKYRQQHSGKKKTCPHCDTIIILE